MDFNSERPLQDGIETDVPSLLSEVKARIGACGVS